MLKFGPIGLGIRRYFLTGIATIFPIVVTGYIFFFIFEFADGLLGRYINTYLLKQYGYEIPGLGIIIAIMLIVASGILVDHLLGKRLMPFLERYFLRLPVIRHIYSPAKQLSDFLFKKRPERKFNRVVLAEYPTPGLYALGFLTNEAIRGLDQATGHEMVSVLIPTPPSPFTGQLAILPREKVRYLDMTMEEAIKFIVSAGLAAPEKERAAEPRP